MKNPFSKNNRGNRIVHFINDLLVFNIFGDTSKLKTYVRHGWIPYYITYVPRINRVIAVNYTKQNADTNCKRLFYDYDERAVTKLAFAKRSYGYKVSNNQSMTENYSLSDAHQHSKGFYIFADILGVALLGCLIAVNVLMF